MIGARDPMGLVGQTLDGQFRIDEFVGEGGFSVVYRGYHTGLGEIVAIKCLKLQSSLGSALVESFLRRFRDEGRILYRLSQGNLHIVRSMASGTTIAGTTGSLVPYTVLEWLEGHSLAQDFERRRAAAMRGRPMAEAAMLFSTAFEAVAYAHQAGVIHRDLNPGNIFLTQTREGVKAKVLDFGVAKIISDHALEMGPRAQTLGQIKIFSPAYAAPEQFDEKLGKVGAYTDVYTLAIVFLEALRDEPALNGDNIAALISETLDENRRPTPRTFGLEVSDAVEKVFQRATALRPADRQQSGAELWTELAAALHIRNISLPVPSLKTPPPGQVAPPPKRPQFASQTVRMESPLASPLAATTAASPPRPDNTGTSGLASTVAGNDMDGRFSATMLAPENMAVGTAQTMMAPLVAMQPSYGSPPVTQAMANPLMQPMAQPQMQQPHMQQQQMAQAPPILPLQQSSPSLGGGFNDETGIVRVSSDRTKVIVAVVVGVFVVILLLGLLGMFWFTRTGTLRPVSTAPVVATATAIPTETATAIPTATATEIATAIPTATETATETATATATPTGTASPTPTATVSATPTSTPKPIDPNAFNATAANKSLGTSDAILISCSAARGQKGIAHVTFANDGTVQAVTIDPAAMPGAECVASRYKLARTLRFEGPPQAVDHAFHIAK